MAAYEQAQPFLDHSTADDDVELSSYDGHRDDHTPVNHFVDYTPAKPGTKSPLLVAAALILTVIGFTINTESTAYFEDVLGWKKPFATLYITHSSLALPWLCHLAYLRYQDRHTPYSVWVRDYNNSLRAAISSIDAYVTSGPRLILKAPGHLGGPLDYLATTMAFVTGVLTISGSAWFLSLALTTPSDLTAIYNTSTFFAAAFSIPLLRESLGPYSIAAVALSIIGTFVIAYGDSTASHPIDDGSAGSQVGTSRLLGNLIACAGAVAFGLYEVLFKKFACSSRPNIRPEESLPLTLAASALTGVYTFVSLWPALIVLHIFGFETFVIPSAKVAGWIAISVLSGSFSITLLVVLVIWTSPTFGSMANVLSVFTVAIADWLIFGLAPSLATYAGGVLIVVAFGLLAWDTFKMEKRGSIGR